MVTISVTSEKVATLGLLKTKVFWNKRYGVITFVYEVTNKILSCDSNYIVNVIMWPKSHNSSTSRRKLIVTLILKGFGQKNHFCGVALLQVNNLGLALNIALKFYSSVAKGLELKVRKIWGLIPTFVHGTIKRTGITCKIIPCYRRDSACRWFIVKKAKIP